MTGRGKERSHTARRFTETNGTRDIKCPFFKGHNSKEIACEGIITGQLNKGSGSLNVVAFCNKDLREFYERSFCEDSYKKCVYCQMLMGKYEDEP